MNSAKLRQENNRLHHELNRKNDYKMTDMITYLRDQEVSQSTLETLRHELLSQALEAQAKGKAIETAFGHDLRAYVDEQVGRLAPMNPQERRLETFRLWGLALLLLTALSVALDLAADIIARSNGAVPLLRWTLSIGDLALLVMLLGAASSLSLHFSRFQLEKDPDFFSASGNRLGGFVKSYGLTLVILLAGAASIFFFGQRKLFALTYLQAGMILALLSLSYLLIRARLQRSLPSKG